MLKLKHDFNVRGCMWNIINYFSARGCQSRDTSCTLSIAKTQSWNTLSFFFKSGFFSPFFREVKMVLWSGFSLSLRVSSRTCFSARSQNPQCTSSKATLPTPPRSHPPINQYAHTMSVNRTTTQSEEKYSDKDKKREQGIKTRCLKHLYRRFLLIKLLNLTYSGSVCH